MDILLVSMSMYENLQVTFTFHWQHKTWDLHTLFEFMEFTYFRYLCKLTADLLNHRSSNNERTSPVLLSCTE